MAGKSKLAISQDEYLNRGTVDRILSQAGVVELGAEYHQKMLELVPFCILALKDMIVTPEGMPRGKVEWRMLIQILKWAQVLVQREVREKELPWDRFADWTDADPDHYIVTGERPRIWPK
jgi:hypothetical protein